MERGCCMIMGTLGMSGWTRMEADGGFLLSLRVGRYGMGDGVDLIGSSKRQESRDLRDLVDD